MTVRKFASIATFLSGLCLVSNSAKAQSQCNQGNPCIDWQNIFNGGGIGIRGSSTAGTGINGISTSGIGVSGLSNSYVAVAGTSTSYIGVYAQSTSSVGTYSTSTNGDGTETVTYNASHSAIYAHNNASGGGGWGIYAAASGNGQAVHGENSNSSGWAGYFNGKLFASSGYKPGGGSWTDSSDARLKKNIEPLEGALPRLLQLKGVTYEWKDPSSHGNLVGRQTGMIAQEVEKVFPEWIGTDANGYRTLTFRGFEALSVEAMRTLQKQNEMLRSQVSSLENRVRLIEDRRPIAMAGFSTTDLGAVGGLAFLIGGLLVSRQRRSAVPA